MPHRPGAARRQRLAGPVSTPAATSPGTRRLGRPASPGWSGTCRRCRSTSPGSCSRRSTAARAARRRGRRRGLGRPAPVLARRVAPRVRLGRDRLVERLGRRRRRLDTRARCSRSRTITRSRRGRPASVRSRGRPTARRSRSCRNEDGFGRLVRRRRDGTKPRSAKDARELAKGWHHSLDWGPDGIVAVRSGARTPPTVTIIDPDTADAARARARRARGHRARRGRARDRHVARAANDDGARPALPAGESALGPDTAPPLLVLVHGGPTDQATAGWQPRGRVLRRPRVGGAAARPPRLDRLRARVRAGVARALGRARRRRHRGGHPRRGGAGLVRPGPRRGHGRERGRAHDVARVRAARRRS